MKCNDLVKCKKMNKIGIITCIEHDIVYVYFPKEYEEGCFYETDLEKVSELSNYLPRWMFQLLNKNEIIIK